MSKVASFKSATTLTTDKKVNLIYGLNGTGKSTLSDFLYTPTNERFSHCQSNPILHDQVFVYNQSFIRDNFYVADNLKGIFSLSKINKEAEETISQAENEKKRLEGSLSSKLKEILDAQNDFKTKRSKCLNDIWVIKTDYSGGDRVLEYCLEGLKGQKERLLDYILSIPKPTEVPLETIPQLKKDVQTLQDSSASSLEELPELVVSCNTLETHSILNKVIIGNANSSFAGLIDKLQNSDWVKEGLQYLPREIEKQGSPCPFCQERTITSTLVKNISEYFDDAYETDLSTLRSLEESYRIARESVPMVSEYVEHELIGDYRPELEKLYGNLIHVLDINLHNLESKLRSPHKLIELTDSTPSFNSFNNAVRAINNRIRIHNTRVADREASLQSIKSKFWELMRWQYDQTLARYTDDKEELNIKIISLKREAEIIELQIATQEDTILVAQNKTINIDQAVTSINARLLDLGIEDFNLKKYSDTLYRIVRQDQESDAFPTLSEGEKMIISFLYFCELSLGRLSADDTGVNRILVIDDPISSLSHIYVFNVGQLIKRLFFHSERFIQVFVLTHCLYFFYEMTDPNHERRKMNQKLFRITKNTSGSQIQEMKYEEIQNDYQAYWAVINDPSQPPALLANCMRNIIEYFFNFVKKKDYNNVFQMNELQDTKYQAFSRYVNRESHSLGQNILDLKEFDYDLFREGLRLVFVNTGYADHYDEMSKI